ncbi:DUF3291 domain-containing protein, partial [Opacimonas viscosa]
PRHRCHSDHGVFSQIFDKMDFHLVMWWIEEGRLPTAEEARLRLSLLQECGPTASAFTFAKMFPAPAAS